MLEKAFKVTNHFGVLPKMPISLVPPHELPNRISNKTGKMNFCKHNEHL